MRRAAAPSYTLCEGGISVARKCWNTGLLLIWASVGVIAIGTHLQACCPRFGGFRQAGIGRETGTLLVSEHQSCPDRKTDTFLAYLDTPKMLRS